MNRDDNHGALRVWRATGLLLWGLLANSCGAYVEDTGGESNWLRCDDEGDCVGAALCIQKRCVEQPPESDGGELSDGSGLEPPPLDRDAGSSPSSDDSTDAFTPVASPIATQPSSPATGHCAFSGAVTRASAPSGMLSAAVPLPEPGCVTALSAPLELEVTESGASRFAFSYDVNDDGVEDLFFRSMETVGSFDLWVSRVEGGALRFAHEPCALPIPVWEAQAWYVRDIDDDGVPDLVLNELNAVSVYRNTASEVEHVTTMSFEYPGRGGFTTLLRVEVADVVGDETPDLIFGYDRFEDPGATAYGVRVLEGRLGASFELNLHSVWLSGYAGAETDHSGLFAVMSTFDGPSQLWLHSAVEGAAHLQEITTGERIPLRASLRDGLGVWSTERAGGLPLLVVLGGTEDTASVDWLFPNAPFLQANTLTPVFPVARNREWRGMPYPAWSVLDADGNGAADFVELSLPVEVTSEASVPRMAIHLGDLLVHFEQPIVLELPRNPARATSPFAAIAEQALGLVVYEGPAAAQVFQCVEP